MTHRRSTCGAILGGAVALVALVNIAHADPVVCQKQVIKTLASFKKISLTATEKCLDKENQGKLPGPCPDTATQLKIQKKSTSATDKISTSCTMADLTALGFPGNCQFEAATQGQGGAVRGATGDHPDGVLGLPPVLEDRGGVRVPGHPLRVPRPGSMRQPR